MQYIFEAELSVYIKISDDDFAILEEVAARHYDATVRSTTDRGGHLYGAKIARTHSPDNKEVKFTLHELGLACKSLEFFPSGSAPELLRLRLIKIAEKLIDERKKLNDSFCMQKVTFIE